MPGEANALVHQINVLKEKLNNAKDPAEKARLQDSIKDLEEQLKNWNRN